jgi:hypothetical protein
LLALNETRYCGSSSEQVMRRMNALVKNLGEVLPADLRQALRYWEQRREDTIDRSFDVKEKTATRPWRIGRGSALGMKSPGGTGEHQRKAPSLIPQPDDRLACC